MKTKLLSTAAAIALTATAATAGNIAPPPPDPIVPFVPAGVDWTGFYGGVQLGYANIGSNAPGINGDGFIGGIILGYDYDFGSALLGVGIDYDFLDVGITPGVDVENVFRAKVRGGIELGRGLIYATGGYAQADASILGSEDGYFIGAGYDHLITDQFSLGYEVLYHEFDDYGPTLVDVDATTLQIRGAFRF